MMTRRERSVVTGKTPVYGRRKVSRGAGKVWKRTHNGCAFGLRQGETLNTLTIILPDTSKQRRAHRVPSHIVMHARRACHNLQAQAEHISLLARSTLNAQSIRVARSNVCRALVVSI